MLGSDPSFSIWLRRAVETTYSELRSVSAISRLASSTWRRVKPKRSRICFRRNPACSLRMTLGGLGTVGNGWDITKSAVKAEYPRCPGTKALQDRSEKILNCLRQRFVRTYSTITWGAEVHSITHHKGSVLV